MGMFTIKKEGQKVKALYDENGNFISVVIGELLRFVATWKGKTYKGLYLRPNSVESEDTNQLRDIFISNQLQNFELLIEI